MATKKEKSSLYEVEKVVGRRTRKGSIEYFLKWVGYPNEENTWEPLRNLNCKDLIATYEADRKLRRKEVATSTKATKINMKSAAKDRKIPKPSISAIQSKRIENSKETSTDSISNNKKLNRKKSSKSKSDKVVLLNNKVGAMLQSGDNGFQRGLDPEEILGVSDLPGEIVFLIKFKGLNVAELIPASIVNVKCPQLVIKFWEERISFHSDDEDSNTY